jgi:hypothetical protein
MEIVLLILVSLLSTGEVKQEIRRMDAPEDCYHQMLLRKIEPLPEGVIDGRSFCLRVNLDPLRGSEPI